jgi:hypothetical protein
MFMNKKTIARGLQVELKEDDSMKMTLFAEMLLLLFEVKYHVCVHHGGSQIGCRTHIKNDRKAEKERLWHDCFV